MRPALFFLVTSAMVTAIVPVSAQERDNNRTLGGHSFVTSSIVDDAFTGTYVRTTTGAGRAVGLEVPVYDLDSNVVATLGGNIAFLSLGLGYQQRLAKWVAVRASFTGAARTGTNHITLLAEGASAVYGGTFGATFRLVEKDRFFLSAIAETRSNSIYAISPLDFVRDVIEGGAADSTTSLLEKGDNWRLVGGLRTAYGFSPLLGVSGLVEYGPAKRFFADEAGDRNTSQFRLGGSVSVDLRHATPVPIGFVGSLNYQSENDRGDDIAGRQATFGLGVFYTGRRDLTLGLETAVQRFDQRDLENKVSTGQIRLVLRYDF
jgi:hypothetical protein